MPRGPPTSRRVTTSRCARRPRAGAGRSGPSSTRASGRRAAVPRAGAGRGPEHPFRHNGPHEAARHAARLADAGEVREGRSRDGAMSFEPKWDGFRSIVFRDGDEVEIGSRNERPMTRYFPEVVEALRAERPRALRARRRDRRDRRVRRPARLRGPAAADPPGRQPGAAPREGDAGPVRRVRPAGARRRRPHEAAVRRAPGRARGRPEGRRSPDPRHGRPPPTGPSPRTGSRGSRAPDWTASSRSRSAARTSRTSG